nr:hypothetical protein [Tanacetum cinerariifolium]
LSRAVDSNDTNAQLAVFFRREAAEDSQKLREFRRLSTELRQAVRMRDRMRGEMAAAYEKRMDFMEELESVRGIIAHTKATKFLKDTQLKDDTKLAQLCDLERQMKLRAIEKWLFIQRLLCNVPF